MIDREANAVFRGGCELRYEPRQHNQRNLGSLTCSSCGSFDWVIENETPEQIAADRMTQCPRLSEGYKQTLSVANTVMDSSMRGDGSLELVAVTVNSRRPSSTTL